MPLQNREGLHLTRVLPGKHGASYDTFEMTHRKAQSLEDLPAGH